MTGIVTRLNARFERKNLGRFEKWRLAAPLRDRITAGNDIPTPTLDTVERIYRTLNNLFTPPLTSGVAAHSAESASPIQLTGSSLDPQRNDR